MLKETLRIVVMAPFEVGFGSDVLCGLRSYAIQARPWTFEFKFRPNLEDVITELSENKPDGLIVDPLEPVHLPLVCGLGVPFVTITEHWGQEHVPRVGVNEQAIGRMAAQHFLERGYHHYAFCGHRNIPYSVSREVGFRSRLEEAGFVPAVFNGNFIPPEELKAEVSLKRWIMSLTKPCAVFACHDHLAFRFCQLCRNMGISVPSDLAVLGVDNDVFLCEFGNPHISSIDPAAEQVGYQAGALLGRLIAGESLPDGPILIPPKGVVKRHSTDVLAIVDPLVAKALYFIREHSHEPISVSDVLREVPLSRRTLERRFGQLLGRSPRVEICRVHLERAKELLVQTDLQMAEVARRSGFLHPNQMANVFKRDANISPSGFRRQFRTQK